MKVKANNFREGYFKLNDYLFFHDAYDYVRGQVTAHKFHVELIFETANCDMDMSEINYTPSKWKQLIRTYLDNDELAVMCARLLHYKNKGGKHKKYIPDIGMNFNKRRNASGACLMSFTVGYNQAQGWHAEVFTRASELTMRWFMDLIFIHVLLREIGYIIGFDTDECRVYWHMVSSYQSITSMPLFLIMEEKEDWLINNMPLSMDMSTPKPEKLSEWQWGTVRRYFKSFINEGYMNFKVQRRPIEAYKIMKGEMEPKKAIPTKELRLPDIDYINQVIDYAEEEEMFNAKGAV